MNGEQDFGRKSVETRKKGREILPKNTWVSLGTLMLFEDYDGSKRRKREKRKGNKEL